MEQYVTEMKISHAAAVDVTEDFELPDYQPEIRKTAGVQCSVTRDSAYLEENTVEVSGCVLYTVLYLSGEGGLASVPVYSTWSAKIPLPEEGGIGIEDLFMTAECESTACRVTGPRKLTLSARIRLRCAAVGDTECTPRTDPGAAVVLHTEQTPVTRLKTCRHTGTVSGEAAGGKVIACRGSVLIAEAVCTPEGMRVTGEAVVRLLVLGENGSYTTVRSRAPIAETIPCPRSMWDEQNPPAAAASGKCAALTVTNPGEGQIGWEMEYDLEGILLGTGTSERAADGYCTTHEDTPVFSRTDAVTGGSLLRGQVTLSGEKVLRGDDTGSLQFLYGWGRGIFEKGERLPGGGLLLTGTAHCTALLTGNGDVTAEEVTLPIRYEWDAGRDTEGGDADCRCSFDLPEVSGHMEGNVLHLHAEACCSGAVFTRTPCTWLQSLTCRTDRPLPHARPAVILYTPEPGETPWDVQKRYRTENITETDGRYVIRK